MQELIEKYVQLRDAKAALTAAHKVKVEKLDGILDQIEGLILQDFTAKGIESVRTDAGTAYKSLRTSAPVADWDATLAFIKQHDLWGMLEKKVSKKAVEEYKEEHGDLPPGLNWREEIVINVRRS